MGESDLKDKVLSIFKSVPSTDKGLSQSSYVFEALAQVVLRYKSSLRGDKQFIDSCINLLFEIAFDTDIGKDCLDQNLRLFNQTFILFISLCSLQERATFFGNILEAIIFSIANKGEAKIIPITKTGKEKICKVEETGFHIHYYFTLLECYIRNISYMPEELLDKLINMLTLSNIDFQYLTIRCLSQYQCKNTNDAFKMLRTCMFIMVQKYSQISLVHMDTDKLVTSIFQRALHRMPKNHVPLLGREFLPYIYSLKTLKAPLFFEKFFEIVLSLIEADRNNSKLSSKTIIDHFEYFHQIKSYVKICSQLICIDQNIIKILSERIKSNVVPTMLPALQNIPNFEIGYPILKNASPEIFFETTLKAKRITAVMRSLASQNFKTPPKLSDLNKLYKIFPDEIMKNIFNYPPEYQIRLFGKHKNLIIENLEAITDVAESLYNYSLMALVAITCAQEKIEAKVDIFTNLIEIASRPETYCEPYYVDAIPYIVDSESYPKIITLELVKVLLRGDLHEGCIALLNNKDLCGIVFGYLMEILKDPDVYLASSVLNVIKGATHLIDLIAVHKYEAYSMLFELYRNSVPKFSEFTMTFDFPQIRKFQKESKNENHIVTKVEMLLIYQKEITAYLFSQHIYGITTNPNIKPNEESNWQKLIELAGLARMTIDQLIQTAIPDILICGFTTLDNQSLFQLLKKITAISKETSAWQLVKLQAKGILPSLILYTGCQDLLIQETTRSHLFKIATSLNRSKSKDNDESMRALWKRYFYNITCEFSKMLASDTTSAERLMIINSLSCNMQYINENIDSCFNTLYEIANSAIKYDDIRVEVLRFWEELINDLSDKQLIASRFKSVVYLLLPCFFELPQEVTRVLELLIVDYKDITGPQFKDIAFDLPILENPPELAAINQTINEVLGEHVYTWKDEIELLIKQIQEGVPLRFRKLLLKRLYTLLRQNEENISELNCTQIVNDLWSHSLNETDSDNLIYYGRCLSVMPFVKDAKTPEVKYIDKNDKEMIVITLISDFCVNLLKEVTSAAYVIQTFLTYLQCNQENSEEGNENWMKFDEEIRNIISPYRSLGYTIKAAHTFQPHTAFERTKSQFSQQRWLHLFFCDLIHTISFDQGKFLEPVSHLSAYSFALAKFVMPYLCCYNVTNQDFKDRMRLEWNYIVNEFKNYPHNREHARAAISLFYSVFDSLTKWSISPSTNRRLIAWEYLEIASDLELARVAHMCQLSACRIIMHIDLASHDPPSPEAPPKADEIFPRFSLDNEDLLILKDAYTNVDLHEDADVVQHMTSNGFIADGLAGAEMEILDEETRRSEKIEHIEEMVRNGRYDRALSDAKSIRIAFQGNMRIDAAITRCALPLGRWDEITQLVDENALKWTRAYDESARCVEAPDLRYDIGIARLLNKLESSSFTDFQQEVDNQRKKLAPQLTEALSSSYAILPPLLVKIRLLDEIELFGVSSNSNKKYNMHPLKKWIEQEPVSLDILARVASVRCAIVYIMKESIRENLTSEWLDLGRSCRKADELFAAEMFCSRARKLCVPDDLCRCLLELGKITWAKRRDQRAISILTGLTPTDEQTKGRILYLKAKWSDEINTMDSATICKTYLESMQYLKSSAKSYYSIATHSDLRIENYFNFISSEGQETRMYGNLKRMKSTIFWDTASTSVSIMNFMKSQIPFALKNYLQCIIHSPQYASEVIPRVLSLFFDNGKQLVVENPQRPFSLISKTQMQTVLTEMAKVMEEFSGQVSSEIWMASITQLNSRVEQPEQLESFLFKLYVKAVNDYPDQTMWHLMSIKHFKSGTSEYKFDKIWDAIVEPFKDDAERSAFLEDKLNTFLGLTKDIITLIQTPCQPRQPMDVKAEDLCQQLYKDMAKCGVLMPVISLFQQNGSAPRIESMDENVFLLASQQRPKRIMLMGSDGSRRKFLCKHDDDLRKDMRLMEFATFVNTILTRNRRCRHRMISMQTYAVVCLEERSGMIEWVDHTESLLSVMDRLIRERNLGLPREELEFLLPAPDVSMSQTKRFNNFTKGVLPHYPPLLHLWFAEKFVDAAQWLQARSNYIRSTAVWSIVGYIVGLGDRHVENVMFNEQTGATVHVDFNLMFDKAKTLQAPEVVPFRLTHNMVAAMGHLGTEGTFKSTAVLIMETLRTKQTKLISVLQTMVNDPFLEWKKSGKEAEEITAKMTLKEVQRRMTGASDDRAKYHSTEYVVDELINQATSLKNLSMMWVWWMPFY